MREWPPIHDPQTLEWLALDDAGWRAALEERILAFGRRTFDDAALEFALGYPWERPAGSYVLRAGEVELVGAMPPGDRDALVAAFARDRHPVVAFGANGAPARLRLLCAAFTEPADREVLVLTGALHGVDVGAQASPTAFGCVPGTLFASPGTAVRAAVLWLTPAQLALMTKAELSYRLGRLERARFVIDETAGEVDDVFAYVSRIGALRVDGGPVALAAVPAVGRTAPAMTQEQVLDVLAARALGPDARAADLVRLCCESGTAYLRKIAPVTWPTAVRLPGDHWTAYPTAS